GRERPLRDGHRRGARGGDGRGRVDGRAGVRVPPGLGEGIRRGLGRGRQGAGGADGRGAPRGDRGERAARRHGRPRAGADPPRRAPPRTGAVAMIAALHGTVSRWDAATGIAWVDVQGVTYEVRIPAFAADWIASLLGTEAT